MSTADPEDLSTTPLPAVGELDDDAPLVEELDLDDDGVDPDADEFVWDDGKVASAPRPAPRRRKGGGGTMLGAAMLGLRDIMYGKPKEDSVIEIEASGDPPNLDLDGLDVELDATRRAVGPPLDEIKARAIKNRRRPRR